MKKLILCLFFTSSALWVTAQNTPKTQLDKAATELSQQLARDLQLNEHGYLRIKALSLAYLTEKEQIQENYSYNPELQWTKLSDLDSAFQQRIFLSLRTYQMEAFVAAKKQKSIRYLAATTK